jgi:hypothetical protein
MPIASFQVRDSTVPVDILREVTVQEGTVREVTVRQVMVQEVMDHAFMVQGANHALMVQMLRGRPE